MEQFKNKKSPEIDDLKIEEYNQNDAISDKYDILVFKTTEEFKNKVEKIL